MRYRALWIVTLLGLWAATAAAQATTPLVGRVDSRLWIEGASNVSRWSCRAKTLDATIFVDSGFSELADLARHLRNVTVNVPVAALTCGHAPMDRSLRAALKAAPGTDNIVATLDAVAGDESSRSTLHTTGTLRLAGRENAVTVDIAASVDGSGLEAHGELPILLSDYGIEPPSGLLGVIRCADRVVVKFALTVDPRMAGTSATTTSLPH